VGEHWREKRTAVEERQQLSDSTDTEKMAVVQDQVPLPVPVSAVSERTMSEGATSILSESTAATELSESPIASKVKFGSMGGHTQYDTNPDGTVNAKPTGTIFPTVLRHNTDTSVSNLHIPGEFPRGLSG